MRARPTAQLCAQSGKSPHVRPALLLLSMLPLAACGKTNAEAFKELAPAYADARATLKTLAGVVGGEVTENRGLEGAVYDERDDLQTTMMMLMPEQLEDPEFRVAAGDANRTFDPIAGGIYEHCLAWTGPKNPMSASALGNRDGDEMLKKCDLKRLRTVVVVKTLASNAPQLVEEGKFIGGQALMEVTAIDWASQKALTRFRVEGLPAEHVEYRVKPGESKAAEAAKSVHSTMWSDARKKLFAELRARGAVVRKD